MYEQDKLPFDHFAEEYAAMMKSNYLKDQPSCSVHDQDLVLQLVSWVLRCFFLRHQQVNKKWTACMHHSQSATIKLINGDLLKYLGLDQSNGTSKFLHGE